MRGKKITLPPEVLSSIDWSRYDSELAKLYGVGKSTMWKLRVKAGQRVASHRRKRKDWSHIDVSLPCSVIAKQFGFSRQRAHQIKQLLKG